MRTSLDIFTHAMHERWSPLSSALVEAGRQRLETLLRASPDEAWLGDLHRQAPPSRELYRDAKHGFVLLAHMEPGGTHRPPHDHGRSWVLYGVQDGEMEMTTYARLDDPVGGVRLVKRETRIVRPGEVQVYLPGDIHETRCLTRSALLFRFSERDLKVEDQREHRVTRYHRVGENWTAGAA